MIKDALCDRKVRVIIEIMIFLAIFKPISFKIDLKVYLFGEELIKTEKIEKSKSEKGYAFYIFDVYEPLNIQEQAQINYIKTYFKIAQKEDSLFNIPASIKLAQGLLESQSGQSRIALESNNHFGMKCRKKCHGCTCRNYEAESKYDMFRVFETPADSFRAHSEFLKADRYKICFLSDDYKNWAVNLKKAGYATDKNYHKKLISLIEKYKLYEFDQKILA